MMHMRIVDRAIKKVWLEKISQDYIKLYLLKEDSLKNAFYYHLRRELGDEFLNEHHLRIFTEFYHQGEWIDLVVAQMDASMGNRPHLQDDVVGLLATIEMKYKMGAHDAPFHSDVRKVLQYIKQDEYDIGQYYLAFIQEADYCDKIEEFTWLTKRQQMKASGKLTEMTGIFLPNSPSPVWRVHSYNQMNTELNKTVYSPEGETGNYVI